MKIIRQKVFSLVAESSFFNKLPRKEVFNSLPKIIQNYYKVGLNKDFLKLSELQDTLGDSPFPTPCFSEVYEKDGITYLSLFADTEDLANLGGCTIWYRKGSDKLYKCIQRFFSKKFIEITNQEFKTYLSSGIEEDDEVGEAWLEHPNYNKISSLEKEVLKKINKL